MILLEPGNRILYETVLGQFAGPEAVEVDDDDVAKGKKEKKEAKRPAVDIKLCDFDDTSYRVTIDSADRSTLLVSMNLPAYRQAKDHGCNDAFKAVYGDLVHAPQQDMDLTVAINLDTLAEDKKESLARQVSLIKSVVIGGVFKQFYGNLQKDTASPHFKFDLRNDTTVYFVSDKDRCTTIFGLDFKEKVDKVLARVFMQEFVDARRRLGFAPTVSFTVAPPAELGKGTWGITEPNAGDLGYVSFGVLKSHVKDSAMIDKITSVLQSFRNYIQYHIKCSKSYFHSRMRARCVSLLKVLNRAKVEDPEKDKTKGKKTISGKTFRRAGAGGK